MIEAKSPLIGAEVTVELVANTSQGEKGKKKVPVDGKKPKAKSFSKFEEKKKASKKRSSIKIVSQLVKSVEYLTCCKVFVLHSFYRYITYFSTLRISSFKFSLQPFRNLPTNLSSLGDT